MARKRSTFHIPGLAQKDNDQVVEILQHRLAAYNDLHLTLKHVHWNVVGRGFIGVHEMLDPQVELVRGYADEVAERTAAMGASPRGRAGDIIALRDWDDYELERDTVSAHLAALDKVYEGVIESNRADIEKLEELDPVTQDLLIGHTGQLEKFHWFVRAHLEGPDGLLVDRGTHTEQDAAAAARATTDPNMTGTTTSKATSKSPSKQSSKDKAKESSKDKGLASPKGAADFKKATSSKTGASTKAKSKN